MEGLEDVAEEVGRLVAVTTEAASLAVTGDLVVSVARQLQTGPTCAHQSGMVEQLQGESTVDPPMRRLSLLAYESAGSQDS
eukprot:387413-Prymnesium_polylepis.1